MSRIFASAPGRICLFGDHQDYLNLPVIACAIDRMMQLEAVENGSDFFELILPDLNQSIALPIAADLSTIETGNYFKTALKVLRKRGIVPTKGYQLTISSDIPVNAGLSSSSALTIVWISFLVSAFGKGKKLSPTELALLAYETEVIEQQSSGGKMDQFSISLGNSIYLDTKTDHVISFEHVDLKLIVGVSGLLKDTLGTLAHLKTNAIESIGKVAEKIPNFDIAQVKENQIQEVTDLVDQSLKPYLYAAIKNHLITKAAKREFEKKRLDHKVIGQLMNEHHHVLKTQLKITPALMDRMIDNANEAGALGSKIVGSGGGGCIVAIAAEDNEQKIIDQIKAAGAKAAFCVNISTGATSNKTL
tara:strand:- start:2081 stop:3163 length:1083 start_codon:yes stop_codon:yes gene_type:complete